MVSTYRFTRIFGVQKMNRIRWCLHQSSLPSPLPIQSRRFLLQFGHEITVCDNSTETSPHIAERKRVLSSNFHKFARIKSQGCLHVNQPLSELLREFPTPKKLEIILSHAPRNLPFGFWVNHINLMFPFTFQVDKSCQYACSKTSVQPTRVSFSYSWFFFNKRNVMKLAIIFLSSLSLSLYLSSLSRFKYFFSLCACSIMLQVQQRE